LSYPPYASLTPEQDLGGRAIQGDSMQPPTPDDMAHILGQVDYIVNDHHIIGMMKSDPDLRPLYPMISSMLRTSNLDPKTIQLMKLQVSRALRIQLMVRKPATMMNLAKFDAWRCYIFGAIEDTKNGWRGRLATEKIRTYRIEGGAQPRSGGGLLGWFRR